MSEWWQSLSSLNRAFYSAATFFSVFFVWQLLAAFLGLGDDGSDGDGDVGGGDADAADADDTYDNFEDGADADSTETVVAFKLLSIRSIITFFTLFTWGTALYLDRGDPASRAMGISTIWGLAGMGSIALLLYMMQKLVHTGTKNIATCVGQDAVVYLNIPENGTGEIRVTVSGILSYVKARGIGGQAIEAGTPVRVTRKLDSTSVEVEIINGNKKEE